MAETEELLLKLSAQIADGSTVDWSDAQGLSPTLREQLRQIELLAGGFHGDSTQPDADAPAMVLAAGDRFGPLLIRGVLGRGSFGQVYRAWDAELEREVALKLVASHRRSRDEILREARLMARIDHPNVLKVFGALEDRGRIGFAFELIEGETLEAWIGRHDRLGPHALVAIGLELAAALCALHQGQILHGDLKPGNILRHASGRWIVADFGSGQHAEECGVSSGTPRYMAPELFDAGQPSAASDQYALAVVLFRLASRRYPYEGDTLEAIAAAQGRGERVRLLDLRPDLPLPLIEAIERALAPDPSRRFASVGLFAAALSAVISEPSTAPAWRRNLPWLAAAAVLLLAIVWLAQPASIAPNDAAELTWVSSRDGAGRVLNRGDALNPDEGLALELQLDRPRHVYIINQDQAGERFQLFPLGAAELSNPLAPGKHVLPGKVGGETVDWRLTSYGGREYFLVVLADQPIAELTGLQLAEAGSAPPTLLALDSSIRGVGGLQDRVALKAPDWSWLEQLKAKHPQAQFEIFELASR